MFCSSFSCPQSCSVFGYHFLIDHSPSRNCGTAFRTFSLESHTQTQTYRSIHTKHTNTHIKTHTKTLTNRHLNHTVLCINYGCELRDYVNANSLIVIRRYLAASQWRAISIVELSLTLDVVHADSIVTVPSSGQYVSVVAKCIIINNYPHKYHYRRSALQPKMTTHRIESPI